MKVISITTLLMISIGCAHPVEDKSVEFHGTNWNLSTVIFEAYKIKPKKACFLFKKVKVDERPLYVETVGVMFLAQDQWTLSHLFRHPNSKNTRNTKWSESWVSHLPENLWVQRFEQEPTQKQIDSFLNGLDWEKNLEFSSKINWDILAFQNVRECINNDI